MNTPFSNPWKELSPDDLHKTTVNVARTVMSDISRVHSKQGVLQTTIYLLIIKLTNELKRHGLTDYDPAAYERAVADCTIILGLPGRSTTDVPATGEQHNGPAETTSGDVGHGSTGLAREVSRPAPAPSVDSAPKRSRGKRGPRVKRKEGESADEPK